VAVLDWSQAGWYPAYWELCKGAAGRRRDAPGLEGDVSAVDTEGREGGGMGRVSLLGVLCVASSPLEWGLI
jgi:hypothetical protein